MSTPTAADRLHGPAQGFADLAKLTGIEFLRKMAAGEIPGIPIATHIGMKFTHIERGSVTLTCVPDASHYNPFGIVHGGLVCTLLDTALGCAAESTLPAGTGHTSIELKVNYLRPVTVDSGPLACTGHVTKSGRRVTFSEGEVRDKSGQIVATASGTLLIFPLDAAGQ